MAEDRGGDDADKTNTAQEHHHDLYHYVFIIVGSIVTAGIEFALVWPENHHLALLGLAVTVSLVTVYQTRVWRWDINWIIAAVFVWFASAEIINGIVGPIVVPDVEVIGVLRAGNDPTPPMPCKPAGPPDALKIFVGNNVVFQKTPEIKKIVALKVGNCPVATMERVPSGIAIGANLYDRFGKLIAYIDGGELHVLTNETIRADRNGDLSTLIVTDSAKRELLFVRYLNSTTLRIRGIFGCPGHALVQVTDNEIIMSGGTTFKFTDGLCTAPESGIAGMNVN